MDKLRQQITFEPCASCFSGRSRSTDERVCAARLVCRQRLRPSELPTNREIREELQRLTSSYTIPVRTTNRRTRFRAPGDAGRTLRPLPAITCALSHIQRDRRTHPERDVLYHSLQVFRLACEELPYDEEFLAAALLHDVGLGIDPHDPVAAGLNALGDSISERTAWLIENLAMVHDHLGRTIGIRARCRLQNSESGDELILLAKCDDAGRVPGADAPDLEDALAYLRELAD